MAKAKKLPSGTWMVQVYRNGVRKAFTDPDKFIAQQKAAEWLASNPKENGHDLTFRQAAIRYNAERQGILSPSTLTDYECMAAEHYFPFSEARCSEITPEDVQLYISNLAKTRSPKTCRNRNGYIHAVLATQRPDLALKTKLPPKRRLQYKTPSDQAVRALLKQIKGTKYELPVMLAAFGSLRRSEVCALDASDVDRENCIIHVKSAMITCKGKNYIKDPKTRAGDRYVRVPKELIDLIPESGLVCGGLKPNTLSSYMQQMRRKYGVDFRFHDLRHYFASSQHAIGIPDAYIMQAGGWESDEVLKSVYRNTLEEVAKKMADKAVSHYENLMK